MGANVSHVTVLHWDPLVTKVAFGLLRVSPGDVEQGCDLKVTQIVLPGGMVGTAEVKERQDLHRLALEESEERGQPPH